jgi:predicted RNase H-like nuclease
MPPTALPYKPIAGAVPCTGGWLVLPARLLAVTIIPEEPFVVPTLADLVDYRPTFTTMVLDVPIGLPETPVGGYRACDNAARAMLGWPRRVAVPKVPSREALYAPTMDRAMQLEPWLTPLAYRKFHWLREADFEMQPYHQRRIFSATPELSFLGVNSDGPTATSSFWNDGPAERLELLKDRLPGLSALATRTPPPGSTLRQLLNAAALLWTARRIAGKSINRLPVDPEWDDKGRRMEFVR